MYIDYCLHNVVEIFKCTNHSHEQMIAGATKKKIRFFPAASFCSKLFLKGGHSDLRNNCDLP